MDTTTTRRPAQVQDDRGRARSSALAGILLIVFGGLLLVERATGGSMQLIGRLWGLAPLLIGFGQFSHGADTRRGRGRRRSGVWLMFVGVWGLATAFRLVGLDSDSSWPLLIIGVGLLIVWGALDQARFPRQEP